MRRIIAVIEPDTAYAERLAEYLNSNDLGGLKAATFSSAAVFRVHKKEYDTRITIAPENILRELEDEEGCGIRLLLSDNGFVKEEGDSGISYAGAVKKYVHGDRILREVLRVYSDNTGEKYRRVSDRQTRITGVFSPVGRCGKTEFAITLAMVLSQGEGNVNRRVLFITFDEYQGVFESIASGTEYDLSDLIYANEREQLSWSRIEQTVYRFGCMDYIPPVRYGEDLQQLTSDGLSNLIMRIGTEGGYEELVIDFGVWGKRSMELLELCNVIYMPELPDHAVESSKCREFMERAGASEHRALISKIQKVVLPPKADPKKYMTAEEDYLNGDLRGYVRALLTDPKEDK